MEFELEIPKHIEEFIEALPADTRAKMTRRLGLLRRFGPMVGEPTSKPLKDGLFEVRTSGRNAQRLYFGVIGRLLVFVHCGGKSGKKAQDNDIRQARRLLAARISNHMQSRK
ncbi:MAG: type II toxin-antitoxin system RelE/ParE family toxin [Chloroflexota bacterium]